MILKDIKTARLPNAQYSDSFGTLMWIFVFISLQRDALIYLVYGNPFLPGENGKTDEKLTTRSRL